jgi:hypothetical protein
MRSTVFQLCSIFHPITSVKSLLICQVGPASSSSSKSAPIAPTPRPQSMRLRGRMELLCRYVWPHLSLVIIDYLSQHCFKGLSLVRARHSTVSWVTTPRVSRRLDPKWKLVPRYPSRGRRVEVKLPYATVGSVYLATFLATVSLMQVS